LDLFGKKVAHVTVLSVVKGVDSWYLLTSQGTTTSNNCSSHHSTRRGHHSDVCTPYSQKICIPIPENIEI